MTQAAPTVRPRRAAPAPARGPAAGPGVVACGVLVLVDAVALAVAGSVAGAAWWVVAGYLAAGVSLLAVAGRYRPRITLRLADDLAVVCGCVLPPALLLSYPAGRVLPAALASMLAVTVGRSTGYAVLRAVRRRGLLAERTVVVGAGRLAGELVAALAAHPELGLTPYGFVDHRPGDGGQRLPWLGDVAALPRVVRTHRIGSVIVADPAVDDAVLLPVLRGLPGARVYLVPRLPELGRVGWPSGRDEVWGIPVVRLRRPSRFQRYAKRALDVTVAAGLLVLLAPVLLVLGVVARAVSGGSALFRQTRLTGEGRVATVLKLRTLRPGPGPDTCWAVPEERCSPVGRLLRASHADELPQLVNVLRGEMSLVGPRPERPYFAELFDEQLPDYPPRRRMPAGMTGWAQVHGLCGDTSVAERARFDNRYVDDWSLWADLVILLRTLATVVPRRTGGGR